MFSSRIIMWSNSNIDWNYPRFLNINLACERGFSIISHTSYEMKDPTLFYKENFKSWDFPPFT